VILAAYRLNRIELTHENGRTYVLKSRRRGTTISVFLGNCFLRMTGEHVEVLSNEEWIKWERSVLETFYQRDDLHSFIEATPFISRIKTPVFPGVSLHDFLSNHESSLDERIDAVMWALISLLEMHQVELDWGRGVCRRFSHGDATARNVLVCRESRSAVWIDFDTRHFLERSEQERQAEDIRVLLFSSATKFINFEFRQFANAFSKVMIPQNVIKCLKTQLEVSKQQMTTFQLAQSPLSRKDATTLSTLLLDEINGRDLF